MKNQSFFDLIHDAHQLYRDLPNEARELIYWVATLDNEARQALVMAYQLLNENNKENEE